MITHGLENFTRATCRLVLRCECLNQSNLFRPFIQLETSPLVLFTRKFHRKGTKSQSQATESGEHLVAKPSLRQVGGHISLWTFLPLCVLQRHNQRRRLLEAFGFRESIMTIPEKSRSLLTTIVNSPSRGAILNDATRGIESRRHFSCLE